MFRRLNGFTVLLALGMALGGCATNPLDGFDGIESWFNQKKPLPGDRKPVFEDGVPGVPQGVPPELVRGYQPPPEPEPPPPPVAEQPKPKPKPKARPRPKQVATPARQPAAITVQPNSQQPSPAAQPGAPAPAPWPQPGAKPAQPGAPAPAPWPQPGAQQPAASPFPPPPAPPR